jgi:peptide/nickel transport system permease protein
MLNFILKKIIYGFLVLLGVIVVVFFLFNVLPGDAARMTQGQRSDVATLEAVKKEFGLDKPKYQQFLLYINDLSPISILKNDSATREKYHYRKLFAVSADKNIVLKSPYLRRSYQTKKLVTEILWDTIPNTALLAITAMIFATIIAVFFCGDHYCLDIRILTFSIHGIKSFRKLVRLRSL